MESGGDIRFLIQTGQLIRPRTIMVQMAAYVDHPVRQALPLVMACDFVVRVTEGAFKGVGRAAFANRITLTRRTPS